jgi:hypothetical protein
MKDVNIIHVFNGIFFSDGIQYKYQSSYNSRIICHKLDDPSQEIQFSSYDTVQVTDEEAKKIKAFLIDVSLMEKISLATRINDIKRLHQQNVESYLDHHLNALLTDTKNFTPCEAHADLFGQICAVTGKTCLTQCKILKED